MNYFGNRITNELIIPSSIKPQTSVIKVSEVLDKLNDLKFETTTQFKNLTSQEMLVFITIYTLEEEGNNVDYSLLSDHLKLSESSIRDYVQRMVRKNIPIIKEKVNNKKIILKISPDLKKLASLNTLLELRKI